MCVCVCVCVCVCKDVVQEREKYIRERVSEVSIAKILNGQKQNNPLS